MRQLLIAIILFVGLSCNTFGQLSGSGTALDPYLIQSATDFDSIATALDAEYKLTVDIADFYVSYGGTWDSPIVGFTGVFDGDNHTINNLVLGYSGTTTRYSGLFATASAPTGMTEIKNIILTNVSIGFDSVAGTTVNYIGAIVAEVNSQNVKISNCKVQGFQDSVFVINTEILQLGGIAGRFGNFGAGGTSTDSIYRCAVTAMDITLGNPSSGISYAGGIVGYAGGSGTVACRVYECYTKDIVLTGERTQTGLGGIVGYASQYSGFRDNFTYNVLITTSDNTASAIQAGQFNGVSNRDAGLCIKNYAYGTTVFPNLPDSLDGGFSGYVYTSFPYYTNWADSTNHWYSDADYIMSNNHDFPSFSPYIYNQGSFKTTLIEMRTKTTFTNDGWDFDTVWNISPLRNNGFPYLRWAEDDFPIVDNGDGWFLFWRYRWK